VSILAGQLGECRGQILICLAPRIDMAEPVRQIANLFKEHGLVTRVVIELPGLRKALAKLRVKLVRIRHLGCGEKRASRQIVLRRLPALR
jgi:hypothetical protein